MPENNNYSLTFPDGTTQPFSGSTPADAAEKAARQLDTRDSLESAKQDPTTLYVWSSEYDVAPPESEKDHIEEQIELLTRDEIPDEKLPYTPVHIFKAWAWEGEASEDGPAWQPTTITKSDVKEVKVVE
jgi:hypothetical protein